MTTSPPDEPHAHAEYLWGVAVQEGWVDGPMQLVFCWHADSQRKLLELRDALDSTNYVLARAQEWEIGDGGPLDTFAAGPMREWERWQLESELLWAQAFAAQKGVRAGIPKLTTIDCAA